MIDAVTPMIHVPDVATTVAWYESIGFEACATYGDGAQGLSFAILSFGSSRVMFNAGGLPSAAARREVDLYVDVEKLEEHYERLKDRVDLIEPLHDTDYGMREFTIRDMNRFWITFGRDI